MQQQCALDYNIIGEMGGMDGRLGGWQASLFHIHGRKEGGFCLFCFLVWSGVQSGLNWLVGWFCRFVGWLVLLWWPVCLVAGLLIYWYKEKGELEKVVECYNASRQQQSNFFVVLFCFFSWG